MVANPNPNPNPNPHQVLVVVGNGKGSAGLGMGKDLTPNAALMKATHAVSYPYYIVEP